jgi:nitrite reductase/ring-hydroxylating ferredoxin subunit
MTSQSNWQPAIRRDALSDDGMHAAVVGEHRLVVLVADGEVIAYRDACPHEGFALSKFAERQDFVIVCNKHLWEFETGTGEHISRIPRPQCNLTRYPTREVDGMVEVDIGAVRWVEPPTAAPLV